MRQFGTDPNTPDTRGRRRRWPKSLSVGCGLLVLGTGPLFLIEIMAWLGLTTDPNPNPVGFGMLAAVTIWPSAGLIVYGIIVSVWHRN